MSAVVRTGSGGRGTAGRPRAGGGPALCGKGFPLLPAPPAGSGERPSCGAGALRSAPLARAMALPTRLSHFLCHTFPSSNVILCGSGKSSVLRHNRGTSAKRRPVWRRRCRPSTGGAKAGAVCARRQAKNGRPPSQPVRGGLGAYRPRFPFWDVSLPARRSHNPTSCKQPRTCRADRIVQRPRTGGRVGPVRPNASASCDRRTEAQDPRRPSRRGGDGPGGRGKDGRRRRERRLSARQAEMISSQTFAICKKVESSSIRIPICI